MNAQELRIGNWLISARGIPQKVAYLGDTIGFWNNCGGTDKHQKNPIISYDIDKIRPIPLTPEILEKCGFEHTVERFWRNDPFEIKMLTMNAVVYYRPKGYDVLISWCKSLHQLQNLYYSLTGDELKIEL